MSGHKFPPEPGSDGFERIRRAAQQPPRAAREPLVVAGVACGSLEPALGERLLAAGLPLRRHADGWTVLGPVDAAFEAIARWLHAQRLGGRWRDEALAVVAADGAPVGRIERAAVRPLGIATRAVHLVGATPSGEVWIQQRAFDKAVDPGRWDTLMGGMVGAEETIDQTLERETWEEAGLRLVQLRDLGHFGRTRVRRPVSDGYMVEHIDMFEACVPEGIAPANQDGEVERFDRVGLEALGEKLARGDFTVEAALVLAHWLRRPGRRG
ncbi:NUDIX domain-containing protein [Piscinibacter sp. XHJ-5]|uniref:NUDIX hydrolase n=1 Tax=Piscinibacter sp. XHJ-5 TaxID=3037797 RepID=UPI0024533735|nr:NUDIX domain-containing protein [Piscinibacter sp. XHJ-5]